MSTPRWHTREDSGLMLDEDVVWWHDGARVEHPNIIEAFNRGLIVEPQTGRAKLIFGNDWAYVELKGCAFKVVAVDETEDRLSARLSDRTAEWLHLESLQLDRQGRLTVSVKNGTATALFSREAQFEVAQRFEVSDGRCVIRVGERVHVTKVSAAALEA